MRLRKRHNTFKNLNPHEKAQTCTKVELKIGEPELRTDSSQKFEPSRLKSNKSCTTVNRLDPERKKRPSRAIIGTHPNAQTSLIGQLWRMNYGRYSKELSS